ncbi:MAG: hypothetical protein IPK80_29075 [Nannocystis sp.]|nr:hypothetical protein [Nannocystis sp.]
MAEPTTIRLTATAPLNGSGLIPLTRETLQTTTTGRLYSATIPNGSRLTSDIFGIFSSGAHTSITVSASTDNPRDVLRVYLGAAIRSEHRLAGSQTITLAPRRGARLHHRGPHRPPARRQRALRSRPNRPPRQHRCARHPRPPHP